MQKTVKLKLYPNMRQIQQIESTLGACRFLYNKYIETRMKSYELDKKSKLSAYDFIITTYRELKHGECEWLKETNAQSHQHSIIDAEKAYKAFLKTMKETNKRRAGKEKSSVYHPKFKSKRNDIQSYYVSAQTIKLKRDGDKYQIKLPKMGKIRYRGKLPEEFTYHDSRIVKRYGFYYLYLVISIPDQTPTQNTNMIISIDVGIKNYASVLVMDFGDENHESNLLFLTKSHFMKQQRVKSLLKRRLKLQQIVSYKIETNKKNKLDHPYTSNNILKLRRKIQAIDRQFQNIRDNMMYQMISTLVKAKPKCIVMEDLNIRSMLKRIPYDAKRKLRDRISKSAFYIFTQRMKFKCDEYGIEFKQAGKYFASSKICSHCGYKNTKLTLHDRTYICPKCGMQIDRDLNACVNLIRHCPKTSGE